MFANANYDPWSTHVPALATAVARFGGSVLEIGSGWYSTPLLHTMSTKVITLETDAEWAKKFQKIADGQLVVVSNILDAAKKWSGQQWDVVFIDCDPVALRAPCAELFIDRCVVVIHDSQETNYVDLLSRVRYQRHFDFNQPRTSWISNVVDVASPS